MIGNQTLLGKTMTIKGHELEVNLILFDMLDFIGSIKQRLTIKIKRFGLV